MNIVPNLEELQKVFFFFFFFQFYKEPVEEHDAEKERCKKSHNHQ